MEGLLTPHLISVTFTDSIPLFALFFKALSPVLPETFQYFGIWGIFCFMMQGSLAVLLLRRFTDSFIPPLIGSLVYILSPVVLQRMYGHTALAGHWILLSALCLWVYDSHLHKLSNRIALWSVQCAVSVLIHPYFVPMSLIFAFCCLLQNSISSRKVAGNLLILAASVVSVFLTMYLLGAFYGGGSLSESGLGEYSFNLNGFINGGGRSYLLNTLPHFPEQQEGYGCLGFGMLLGAGMAGTLLLLRDKYKASSSKKVKGIRTVHPGLIAASVAFFAFLFLAVSPRVTLGEHVLLVWPLPDFILDLLSVFRASGRFIWPAMYLLYTGIFAVILQSPKHRAPAILIPVIVAMQLLDLKNAILTSRQFHSEVKTYVSPLQSPLWDTLAEGRRHLVLLDADSVVFNSELGYTLAKFALDHHMDINTFNTARLPLEQVLVTADGHRASLTSGGDPDVLYVSVKKETYAGVSVLVYQMDGYFCAAPE